MMLNYKDVTEYSIFLMEKAEKEASVFPTDRAFLNLHLQDILKIHPFDFVFCNLELGSILYSNQLFVCLPEVWQQISIEDLIQMCEEFENIQSYFSLIKFTYKYIEIDIIEEVLKCNKVRNSNFTFGQILDYIKNQWNVLLKTESDYEDFRDGFIDVDYDEWMYLKQKYLINKLVKPALLNYQEMEVYAAHLISKYGNV